MSRIAEAVKKIRRAEKTGAEVNYMGGTSYRLNPMDTLRMVTASSIFGEPQYYRDGEFAPASLRKDASFILNRYFRDYALIGDHFEGKKTSAVMEQVIDEARSEEHTV